MFKENDPANSPRPEAIVSGVTVLLMGVALGAAAVLFLMPKAGQDIKNNLSQKVDQWKTLIADAVSSGREKLINSVDGDSSSGS